MLGLQPLTGSVDLQTGAVDQSMQWTMRDCGPPDCPGGSAPTPVGAGDNSYDLSKISDVVQMLVTECGSIRAACMLDQLKREIELENERG
jgi:hypothetical protein